MHGNREERASVPPSNVPMNDVLIVGPVESDTGGIARYIDGQITQLQEYTPRTHDISPPEGSGFTWFLKTIWFALADIAQFLVSPRPELVHAHTSHGLSFIRASAYVFLTRVVFRRPVILHIHGSTFDDFIRTDSRALAWYQSFVFQLPCKIIVLSSYWEDVLSERTSKDSIEVLPNAIDSNVYDPEPHALTPHIVFVSNLIERKGVAELVEAIEHIEAQEQPEFKMTVAGKGPLSERVSTLANEHENVTYLGYVSEEAKRSILEEGSIYVLPSHAEGLPIAILEGMAAGNAIVATDVGSIPEVIGEDNGRTIPPGDVTELHQAITYLVENPDTVEDMASRNLAVIEEAYSWSAIAGRLEVIYDSCMNE